MCDDASFQSPNRTSLNTKKENNLNICFNKLGIYLEVDWLFIILNH